MDYGNYINPPAYNTRLNDWLKSVRSKYKQGDLIPDDNKALEEIHFVSDSKSMISFSNYKRLMERTNEFEQYRGDHGHLNIPVRCSSPKGLGHFVTRLRAEKQSGGSIRTKIISDLFPDFVWERDIDNENDKKWWSAFKKLEEYVEEYGHADVPDSYTDTSLCNWHQKVKVKIKSGEISLDNEKGKKRITELSKLHFKLRIDGEIFTLAKCVEYGLIPVDEF